MRSRNKRVCGHHSVNQIMGALRQALGAVGSFVLDTVKAFAKGGPIAAAITAAVAAFTWFAGKVDEFMNGAAMAFNDASDSITGALSQVIDGSLTAAEAFDRAFNLDRKRGCLRPST